MSNPFAHFSIDDFEEVKPNKKAEKKEQLLAEKKAKAAQKEAKQAKEAAAAAASANKKADRHTKGGRDAGAEKKRPYDHHLSRHVGGHAQRKGQDRAVKGGWSEKDPQADQVVTDETQAKEVAEEAKVEEAAPVPEAEVVVPEVQPFTFDDAIAAKVVPVEDKKKARKAVNVAVGGKTLNPGHKVQQQQLIIKRDQPKVNANKKVFSLDEFKAVSGPVAVQPAQQTYKRRNKPTSAKDFPSL